MIQTSEYDLSSNFKKKSKLMELSDEEFKEEASIKKTKKGTSLFKR